MCPCCVGELLTTSMGGVPPAVDKLFTVHWGGNTFVLFLPVPTIPDCCVPFKVVEAVCNPTLVGHAAGSCKPPQSMQWFLILENCWSTVACAGIFAEVFLLFCCGQLYGRWPSCLHLTQNGGMGQSRLRCSGCLHLQQMVSSLSAGDLLDLFMPCPFLLLVLVSTGEF